MTDEVEIGGIQTTLPFHRFVARDPSFRAGELSTGWVAEHYDGPAELRRALRTAKLAAGLEAIDSRPRAAPGRLDVAAGPESDGRWRAAGRADTIDRWPR